MSASRSPSRSSTPSRSASPRRRSTAGSTSSGLPWVISAARSTDGIGDPVVEVWWEDRLLCMDEVEDELVVSLRAREAGVYDALRLAPAREQRLGHLANDAPLHGRVAHDALRRLRPPRLELRLDEHERLPARRGERQRGRERELDGDERHVARHELRGEGQLAERAGVHALEHDHTRIVPYLRVQLPVADVERDHAPRGSSTSLKPPVDAPTSSASSPAGSTPNRSSAFASLCPARETYGGGASTSSS